MSRLVCVSNRIVLPRRKAAPGGLAIGVLAALRKSGGIWFGWDGEPGTDPAAAPVVLVREGITYATIGLAEEQFDRYYNGHANSALWPLFHYLISGFRYHAADEAAYQEVNGHFARKLMPLLQPDDLVWVHDYQLIPVGRRLREAGMPNPLGFFLHIPFPHIEMLRVLPTYVRLLTDLCAYDVVGFQTQSDLDAFLAGVTHVYGPDAVGESGQIRIGNRELKADVFPIGIDVAAVRRESEAAVGSEIVRRFVRSVEGRQLLIGVDRLDYSKGLIERFNAYEQYLQGHPDMLGNLVYLQIAPLSRQNVQAYAEIRSGLEQAAGRTNGRFATADWTPIRYLNRNLPHATLMGYLRSAQVGLVTPLRDGMNLVAKEFIAAQDPDDPGILVLSTLAGAARELGSAVFVNPYDTDAIAAAINQVLTMPLGERRERHADQMAALERNDIANWTRRFIAALSA
jgi:trehalose 6-phosphate synthase